MEFSQNLRFSLKSKLSGIFTFQLKSQNKCKLLKPKYTHFQVLNPLGKQKRVKEIVNVEIATFSMYFQ